jgi:hypothetical protein
MSRSAKPYVSATAGALASLLVAACATGQGSFVAGSGGGGESAVAEDSFSAEDGYFDTAAPGLLAAGGNVLLPGGRTPLAVQSGASVNAGLLGVNASAGLVAPLTTANLSASLRGPLLSLGGPRTALLGLSANPALLGSSLNIAASVGGTVTPNTAATQMLINLSAVATTPVTPPIGTPSLPPLLPPALTGGVPGSIPLSALLPRPATPGGGLLGN